MKFAPRRIRDFLKKGMPVTIRERESDVYMYPGEIGLVKDIKCPVVRINPDKRRPYDEFVSILLIKKVDDKLSELRVSVSYDNIQLLGVLEYLSEKSIDQVLADMDRLNAHGLAWSGIHETYLTIKYTLPDGLREERRYDLHVRDSM